MRTRLVLTLLLLVGPLAAPASARQVEGFTLTDVTEKTFDAIPRANPNVFMPTHYELCEEELVDWCDSFEIDIQPGRPWGHVTRFRLTWGPRPGASNRLDMILYNPRVRQLCRERVTPLITNLLGCGSEGRVIGTSHPKEMEIYDLPPGIYVMNVINANGSHSSYTLRGEVELI